MPAQILSRSGPTTEPPEARNLGQGGLKINPGVAQEPGQGGTNFRPPHNEKSITCENAHRERANARADSIEKDDFEKTIDRLLKARKGDYDESLFELARNTIASHHAKFARPENGLPGFPDDAITAQFLAVAEWPKLSDLLSDLAAEPERGRPFVRLVRHGCSAANPRNFTGAGAWPALPAQEFCERERRPREPNTLDVN